MAHLVVYLIFVCGTPYESDNLKKIHFPGVRSIHSIKAEIKIKYI